MSKNFWDNNLDLNNNSSGQNHPSKTNQALLLLVIIAAIIFCSYHYIMHLEEKNSQKSSSSTKTTQEKNETNYITQITKEAPTINIKDSDDISEWDQVVVQVTANDNYDEVIVKMQLYDNDDNIITQQYLTQINLTKGKTYNLYYNLSFTEMTNMKRISCSIYKYE